MRTRVSPGLLVSPALCTAYHQGRQGYDDTVERIMRLQNPVTAKGSTIPVKQKQHRIKVIEPDDQAMLTAYFNQREDSNMVAAINLFKLSGIRPAELAGITVDGNRLIIVGAKKAIMAREVLTKFYSLMRLSHGI